MTYKSTDAPKDKGLERLSRKMKKLRAKQKLSRTELSEKSGVHASQLSKYENGSAFPSDKTLIKLARGLGVTVSELVPEKSYLDMREPESQLEATETHGSAPRILRYQSRSKRGSRRR